MSIDYLSIKQHLLSPFTIVGKEIHKPTDHTLAFWQKACSIGIFILIGTAAFYKKRKYALAAVGVAVVSFYGLAAYFKGQAVNQALRELEEQRVQQVQTWLSQFRERWIAGSTLLAIGDTLGYMNGKVEFCRDSQQIHDLFQNGFFGGKGVDKIHFTESGQRLYYASDDTAMSVMTEKALHDVADDRDIDQVSQQLAQEYDRALDDPLRDKRAYGVTTLQSLQTIRDRNGDWTALPYNSHGGGCGGAMRSMAIGRHYYKEEDKELLVKVALNSGRITHTHPTGFLGAVASASLVASALRDEPFELWLSHLAEVTCHNSLYKGMASEYWSEQEIYLSDEETEKSLPSQEMEKQFKCFNAFLNKLRGESIRISTKEKTYDELQEKDRLNATLQDRDKLYASYAFENWSTSTNHFKSPQAAVDQTWPGQSGHDAPLIAVIALFQTFNKVIRMSGEDKRSFSQMRPSDIHTKINQLTPTQQREIWKDLIERAAMHRGDSDSTAVIACSLYGYCVGFAGVPEHQIREVEFIDELKRFAEDDFAKVVQSN